MGTQYQSDLCYLTRSVKCIDWAQHGICGRGVLLDMVEFYTESGTKPLPYDPWTSHPIPLQDVEACAKKRRYNIPPRRYPRPPNGLDAEVVRVLVGCPKCFRKQARDQVRRPRACPSVPCLQTSYQCWTRTERGDDQVPLVCVVDALMVHPMTDKHDRNNHFAAAASDQPTLEVREHVG